MKSPPRARVANRTRGSRQTGPGKRQSDELVDNILQGKGGSTRFGKNPSKYNRYNLHESSFFRGVSEHTRCYDDNVIQPVSCEGCSTPSPAAGTCQPVSCHKCQRYRCANKVSRNCSRTTMTYLNGDVRVSAASVLRADGKAAAISKREGFLSWLKGIFDQVADQSRGDVTLRIARPTANILQVTADIGNGDISRDVNYR